MDRKRAAAGFGILMGLFYLVRWVGALLSGQVYLQASPEIISRFAADLFVAQILLSGGYGYLKGISWGRDILLIGLAGLLYSTLVLLGPGWARAQGETGAVVVIVAGIGVASIGAAASILALLPDD